MSDLTGKIVIESDMFVKCDICKELILASGLKINVRTPIHAHLDRVVERPRIVCSSCIKKEKTRKRLGE